LERDAEKIRSHVNGVEPSMNGLAVFASSGMDLFESVALAAPIDAHRLYISATPHLYPLARVLDEYPRYLALLADSHSARIFVFAANSVVKIDAHAGERDILQATIAALRQKDAETDRERVDALIGAYRANGLATVGVENTMKAFELGQVDELIIAAKPVNLDEKAAEGLI